MRARNLKPGFFKNEALSELSPYARLLFAGLWCLADREGRMEDRPRRIKAELFPYEDIDVEEHLASLVRAQFITRYSTGQEQYISIPNFLAHQNPHVKEKASVIPAPNENSSSTVLEQENPEQAGLNPESPSLKPDHPNPDPPISARAEVVAMPVSHFAEFWTVYREIRGVGEEQALRVWLSFDCDSQVEQIVPCLASYAASRDAQNGAVMNGERWLAENARDHWRARWPPARAFGATSKTDATNEAIDRVLAREAKRANQA